MTTKLDLVLWTWTHFLKLFYTRAQRRECLRICPNARKSYGLHVACIAITAVILGWTLMLTLATVLDSISVVCVCPVEMQHCDLDSLQNAEVVSVTSGHCVHHGVTNNPPFLLPFLSVITRAEAVKQ